MLPIISWRVWTNTEIFDSIRHNWNDIPDNNIQIICVYHDPAPYKTMLYGVDEFSFEVFRQGFTKFPKDGSRVKLGKWMKDNDWYTLLAKAKETPRP